MKTSNTPEIYFAKDPIKLTLSEKCKNLQAIKTNIWVFEMINLYQSLAYIQKVSYQRWFYCKQENEVLITCYNIQEELIHAMTADIGRHYMVFSDINLCVFEGKCMMEEECEVAVKRDSA